MTLRNGGRRVLKKSACHGKTNSAMEEKLRFVFEQEQGHRSMKELPQRNEITR